ncbi:zona pellucida sperm-binding protein 3-like isoform X2 [Epinephelus moara]|uniref:zona pellucida sperm-binding protein 3-like isoform X2 n=1 Tax=Epinephelus moara TaxID=300413 RepID=UPI00214F36E8|nr:zona pellucida sperm-binding protein 3-like isoform X2 [Epinephelus moara]
MVTRVKYRQFVSLLVVLLSTWDVLFAGNSVVKTRESVGLEIKCEEAEVRIAVKREFFEEKRIPFKPEYLRLGANSTQQRSCGAKGPVSDSEMVISAGLQDCGTEARVHGEWLVYSNQLVLFPAVVPTPTGSVIIRGVPTVIPVECHYRRKQTVTGEPLTPTWLPMTSTISASGLLHFSLRTMADDCTSPRSSSVYQQGEAVFLEASVEAPRHPPLTLCLMDSVLPGSSSKFLPREQNNRLCFSVQAFHFNQEFGKQMFISCNIRATLKQNSHSHLDKACFFHRPTFSWRATEGDNALCRCCDSDDCFRETGKENSGQTTQAHTENNHKADTSVGPLLTLPRSHWTGHLSVNH